MNGIMKKIREQHYEELGLKLTANLLQDTLVLTGCTDFYDLANGLKNETISDKDLKTGKYAVIAEVMKKRCDEYLAELQAARKDLDLPEKSESELMKDGGRWVHPAIMGLINDEK